MWDGTRARLEAAGYDAVAPDLPWDVRERGFTAWADRVLTLMADDVVPVGLSMGGYLAFALWRRAHERIRALALGDTRASPETPEGRRARNQLARLVRERGADAVWETNGPKLFAPTTPAETIERVRRIVFEQRPEGLASTLRTIRDRDDARPLLAAIGVPVLVVVGEDDQLTPPSDSEALAEGLPHARLVRIPGAGHLSPLEQPDVFERELLAFLETVAA
jgi:3-oxoadipate enol-lactonase